MATYYVTKAGSDSDDGSSGSPWLTIQYAVNQAVSNDTIIINDSGVYSESDIRRASGSPTVISALTIKAGTGFTPIVDADGGDSGIQCYTNWVLEGLTIRNVKIAIDSLSGNKVFTVRDCKIYNVIPGGDGIKGLDNGSLVERTIIYDSTSAGEAIDASIKSPTIKNCLIYNWSKGGGITATGGSTVVRNCTIDACGNDAGVSQPGYGIYAPNGTVEYCIVINTDSATAGIRASTHTYNCAYNNSGSDFYGGAGTGDITSSPLFVNSGSSDYTLQVTSPCITPGASSSIGVDITNYHREWSYNHKVDNVNTSTNHDMGCYEEVIPNINGVKTDDISKVMGIA